MAMAEETKVDFEVTEPAVQAPEAALAPVAPEMPAKRRPGRPRKADLLAATATPEVTLPEALVAEALVPEAVVDQPPAESSSSAPAEPLPTPAPLAEPAIKARAAKPAKAPATKVPTKAKPVAVARPAKPAPRKSAMPAPLAGTVVARTTRQSKTETTPVKAAAPRFAATIKETLIMTTANEMTEKFQTAMKDAAEKAKATFEKSQASLGDMGEFAKGNVEAMVESSKILAAGLQEMGKSYVTESKTVIEAMTAEIKDLTSVKSPSEFFEKQAALLRKQFDAAVATSSKSSEAMLKLANDAFQPISNRVSIAVEKIKQAA